MFSFFGTLLGDGLLITCLCRVGCEAASCDDLCLYLTETVACWCSISENWVLLLRSHRLHQRKLTGRLR